MPRNRLLPLLIVLFFITPPVPPAMSEPEALASSARSSWSGPIQLTNSTNSSWDPSIYVDGSGNIHLAWQDGTDRTTIRYKSFAPSGEVIVNDTVLVDHIDSQPPIYLSSRPLAPRLDFNDGELVLFWNETENHPSGQTDHDESLGMLRFSPDLKSRRDCWLPIFAVDRLYYGNPLYAFDSAGNIHFAYAGNLEWNGEPDVWYVKTNSTGAKLFSRLLAKNQTEVGVAVDKWDQVHLVWRNESGGLTYCRLDENGTERARTQLGWWNNRPAAFTIIASDDYQGASVIQNENSDIHYFWIDYNGTSSGPYYPVFWGNVQPHFDPRTPLSVKSDPRGSTHLFGYGVIDDHTDSNYPYYIVDGFSNGISPPSLDIVQGVNLTDYGYTELGPPFSSFVITRASLGSYVAYSSDRLSWEDPAGGINIYMKRLGPFGPDLLIKDIEFSNPNPLEQDSLAIKISVEYNGTEPLTFFGVELLLDEGMLNFSDEILGPDNKTTVIYDWTASKGRHNFTAIAAGEIPELNVSNNQMSVFLDVAGRPDIFVEEIVWDPPAPAVGDRVNITARAVNFGETAGRFTWGIGVNGSVLSTASASLGPGEGGNFSAQWRPALPGNYTLLAMADRTDPYELDLLNNSLEKTVQVSPAPFWVEILSPADGSRVRGLVNVSGRVHGMWGTPVVRVALGDEPAKAVTLLLDGGWSQGWNTSDLPNGRYNIAASAANGWVESMATVLVELDNPVPDAVFRPAGDIFINESEEAAFESEISWGPSLNASIRWEVNGNGLGRGLTKWPAGTILVNTTESAAGILSRLKFLSNWSSNGTYCIRAFVVYFHFELIQTNFTWNLTIKNVNTAPEIWNFSLPENFTARQKDRLNFWVEATDPEEDVLTYAWFIDGRRCETAPSAPVFNLPAPSRAGVLKITLSVSDGEFRVSHDWTVTVLPEKKAVTTGPVMWPWAVVAVVCAATVIGLWAVYRRRKRPKLV